MIGETISHYRILERLGAGGMGEVYKAEDLRLHRHVALKLLLADRERDNDQAKVLRARFLREAQAASALNHPHIATIYEIDEIEREGQRYSFIVMEYVPGHTLKEAAATLSVAEIVEIVLQLTDALSEAHQRGIVHRDIKPSNVIIGEHHRAKILDFGVAKYNPLPADDSNTASLYSTDVMKTMPGTVIGTFAYMSPEQALGKEVDGRSDIFSLGVVFYELLAKRQPFIGSSTLAVVDAILHADPLPLSTLNPQISRDLEAIVHRMLQKESARRYQAMRDVWQDLQASKQGLPAATFSYETNVGYATQLLSDPPSGTQTLPGPLPGTRTLGNRAGKSIAVMSFHNVTRNPTDDWIGTGISETVTADLKNIEGLTVIARERVFEALRRWRVSEDAEIDTTLATSVGREIGARWIVTGGYQKIGEMLRITARFVEVETGEAVQTVKIDGSIKEIFDLQDKIVYELSQGLDLSLRSSERENIELKETEVVEAYEAYCNADRALESGSREGVEEAIQWLEQALVLDPNYARAYAGLGYALTLKGQFLTQPELFERSVEYFQKAIELNPLLADGYAGLGFTFVALGREDDAIGALRRALSFAPQDHQIHAVLGRAYLLGKGLLREAAAEYEQVLQLHPDAGWAAQQLTMCYAYLGEYERGEETARRAIEAQEQFFSGQEGMQIIGSFARLAQIYLFQNRYDDAVAESYRELVFLRTSNHALKERTTIEVYQKLVSAYVRQGNLQDAELSYNQLLKGFAARLAQGADEPFTRYYVACAAAIMGDREQALEHLQKALAGRPRYTAVRARIEPDFESLRDDPEFQALLDQVK